MKKSKGFTLAELLIVVAIIAVLVAIAIPIFSAQLHKAKVATDQANCRAFYADLQSDFLTNGGLNANRNLPSGENSFTLSDSQSISLQTGTVTATGSNTGYFVQYADSDACGSMNWGVSG